MDGWMDGWVDGWMNGWIIIHVHTHTHSCIFLYLLKPGEEIPDTDEKKEKNEEQEEILDTNKSFTTKYRLRGIVVHSGQASGGHYYSFIHVKWDEMTNRKTNR